MAEYQCGVEVVYLSLRDLLTDLGLKQECPTEVWEDNTSCIMMSENPVNQERTQRADTSTLASTSCGTWHAGRYHQAGEVC